MANITFILILCIRINTETQELNYLLKNIASLGAAQTQIYTPSSSVFGQVLAGQVQQVGKVQSLAQPLAPWRRSVAERTPLLQSLGVHRPLAVC